MENANIKKQQLIKQLLNLNVLKRGSFASPHKYLLLLSLIELLEKEEGLENKFTFEDLEPIFIRLFNVYFPDFEDYRKMLEYPFYHMKKDGFWNLKIKKGKNQNYNNYEKKRLTKNRILETVDYAYLDNDVFELFNCKDGRNAIKKEIIELLHNRDYYSYPDNYSDVLEMKETTSLFNHEQSAINLIKTNILHKKMGNIISNILLFDKESNNYLEFDLILVTYSGLFVIELKHWSGHIQIAPYNWIINDSNYRSDPHKANSFKCKVLKSIYQHQFRTYPNIWVQSVVVLTNPEALIEGAHSPKTAIDKKVVNPTFATILDFISYIQKKVESEDKKLNDYQISTVVSFLTSLNQPVRSIKYNVPGYETVDYLSQTSECVELVARPIGGKIKGLNRFRIFRTPTLLPGSERERFAKKAYNTLNAVSQIGDHPNILKVWVIKNDDGDIIEGSEWSEAGTLRDLINNQHEPLDQNLAIKICYGIALALVKAHSVGVIHRVVKPENIVLMNDIPKLMNFDLAYQIEENRITVITDVSNIKDDGYTAPEILLGEDIDESTDYFSFGVIAFELLTGEKPFSSGRSFISQGGFLNSHALKKLQSTKITERIFNILKQVIVSDRNKRLKSEEKIVQAFWEAIQQEKSISFDTTNYRLKLGDRYDVYEIIDFIGQGATAQIYKAKTLRYKAKTFCEEEVVVALKLFNKEIPREKILKEAEITSTVNSSYVVYCESKPGYWKNDRFFLVLDYIDGEPLSSIIERKELPNIETFKKVALGLMEAVSCFHYYKIDEHTYYPLLHSDIKPDNIIITRDRKPVLIDCGIAGEPRVDSFQGTTGYVPPDSILGTDMKFSQEGDLFSLGVTLWEWFFGEKPYINPAVGDKPNIIENRAELLPSNFLAWFLRAVNTEASDRFASIEEMKDAFIGQIKIEDDTPSLEKKLTNGVRIIEDPTKIEVIEIMDEEIEKQDAIGTANILFTQYLNSLSNVSAGNENATAEAQMANELFDRILVPNPIVDFIFNQIFNEKYSVILTGNAGDGKTTIAMQVLEKAIGKRLQLKPISDIKEKNLIVIKDMSELKEEDRLRRLSESFYRQSNKYLIISNTGTLLESFKKLSLTDPSFDESELLQAMAAEAPQKILKHRFMLVNIGNINSIQTACDVFVRMLNEDNWNKCRQCQLKGECPLLANVKLLQAKREVVRERIMLLYRRLYEYNVRLTMRQMVGHLAYAITGGRNCNEINSMSLIALRNSASNFMFSNLFFGDDGKEESPLAMQLTPVRQIRKMNFGSFLDPVYERKIWMSQGSEIILLEDFATFDNKLIALLKESTSSTRRQVRRILYFFGLLKGDSGKYFISVFLRSPMIGKFIELCDVIGGVTPLEENKFRIRILQVLQEFFASIRLPEGRWQADYLYITLSRPVVDSGSKIVLAEFRVGDFELCVKQEYQIGSIYNRVLSLRTKQGEAELILDLPFLDYVSRRFEGEVAEELSTYYTDRLEQFKVKLLNLYEQRNKSDVQYLRLLITSTDRTFRIMKVVVDDDNNLEVLL